MRIRSCGLSDVGRARNHNEDSFEIGIGGRLCVVADGMGGHGHGEVASRIAVEEIHDFVRRNGEPSPSAALPRDEELEEHSTLLREAIAAAHRKVLSAVRSDESLLGMGTTAVGLMVSDQVAAIAHVGDSRAYRFRDGELALLTQDHTWVNEQVMAGYLSEDQARVHPLKNVVTRALGGEGEIEIDIQELEVAPEDLFLLCTDGLTTMLQDPDIRQRLAESESPEEACRVLIQDANERGGLDNITVVLARVEAEDADAPEAAESL